MLAIAVSAQDRVKNFNFIKLLINKPDTRRTCERDINGKKCVAYRKLSGGSSRTDLSCHGCDRVGRKP